MSDEQRVAQQLQILRDVGADCAMSGFDDHSKVRLECDSRFTKRKTWISNVVHGKEKIMLCKIESKKELAEIGRELEAAAQKHKFGVLAVHDLKAKMREKGADFQGECLIYEVCNPHQAKKVLENNLELSTVLPCRISVYQTEKGYTLATLKPTSLVELFHSEGLRAVAEEVERTVVTIMREAANPRPETAQLTR